MAARERTGQEENRVPRVHRGVPLTSHHDLSECTRTTRSFLHPSVLPRGRRPVCSQVGRPLYSTACSQRKSTCSQSSYAYRSSSLVGSASRHPYIECTYAASSHTKTSKRKQAQTSTSKQANTANTHARQSASPEPAHPARRDLVAPKELRLDVHGCVSRQRKCEADERTVIPIAQPA